MASESEALLLDVGSQLMKADEEELEPHHRPWPWRGARCWLAGFVFWLLYCGTVLPHFHAMWGERKFKGAPAWRLMLMVPTGGIILPSLALLAHRVDGCHLSLEEWADQWARSWRPSFRGIRPQTDFSWVFLGAITAMFLADFQLVEMAWPMKVHHVTSLVLVYLFSFVVSTGHPYALTTAAALEVGTAVSNTFYLSGQAAFMRIPYAVVMSFSNGWGVYMAWLILSRATVRKRLAISPFVCCAGLMFTARELEMITVALLNYSFSARTDTLHLKAKAG